MAALRAELHGACKRGDVDALERLIARGLTLDDVRADDNFALGVACIHGRHRLLERLLSLGLTASDARGRGNNTLRWACADGRLEVVELLLNLGLGAADVHDGRALRLACSYGRAEVVCALAAAGVIEPAGELQAQALAQIIRAPADTEPQAERRRAAARAAAEWPDHAEALAALAKLAELAELGEQSAESWEALCIEAAIIGFGVLRFVD